MQVKPENRLVADTLEAEWNRKLQALAEARLEYERQHSLDRQLLDGESERRSWRLYPTSLASGMILEHRCARRSGW
jgi:hypothetical protein